MHKGGLEQEITNLDDVDEQNVIEVHLENLWKQNWFGICIVTTHVHGHSLRWMIINPRTFFKTKLWNVLYPIVIQLLLKLWPCAKDVRRASLHTISLVAPIAMKTNYATWRSKILDCILSPHAYLH
jgi:hypothetical protein